MPTLPQNKFAPKPVTLSERLSVIAESLPEHSVICDVGSDHGALPLFLLSNGLCEKAIVTDLNEKPLERAKNNLREARVDHKATFVLTDGIEEVLPLAPDAFVIAGMGGETILGILDRALSRIPIGTTFVLQPMTKVASLRRFLYEFGFSIRSEKLVSENNKFFIVISAVFDGIARPEKFEFCDYGEFLALDHSKNSRLFHRALLASLESVIEGKKKACLSWEDEKRKYGFLLKILEDFDEDQRD